MRIGIDCRMYSSGFTGIGRYVYELTENLFEIDKQNQYILFFNEPEYSAFSPPNKNIQKILVNAPHYSFHEQTRFLHVLNRAKLDLMHFTHFNAPIFYRGPSIVTIHDLTLSFFPGKKMTSFFQRFAYHITIKKALAKAKKIIAVSEHTKKDLRQLFHIPSEKIEVIYEGINADFHKIKTEDQAYIQETIKKYDIHEPYLLYTGVWRSHKNLARLLEAFHILKHEYDFDGSLVITGRPDALYQPELEQKTLSLQLENDIIFTGLVSDMELVLLYNGSLAYVFPSLYEGFGLPPLEAMQCGVPVVAANSSSIPEICGKDNAVFFDPHDPKDMAQKIYEVISQKSLREKLVTNGFKRVKQFSWRKMAEETLKLYCHV